MCGNWTPLNYTGGQVIPSAFSMIIIFLAPYIYYYYQDSSFNRKLLQWYSKLKPLLDTYYAPLAMVDFGMDFYSF